MKNEIIANSCRICLTQTKKLRSLYKPIDEGDEPPNEMLQLITGIQVEKLEEHEMLPKNICKNCELSLSMAYEFRENALKTQKIIIDYLKELYKNQINDEVDEDEECNRSPQSSNYKKEYEEIMNLEPLDCDEALEDDMQVLDKSCLDSDTHDNGTHEIEYENEGIDTGDQAFLKQQEHLEILNEETENLHENKNFSDDQQDDSDGENNEEVQHNQSLLNDQEKQDEVKNKIEIMPGDSNCVYNQSDLSENNSSRKSNRRTISKIYIKPNKTLGKLTEINANNSSMKLIPRRGRKSTNDGKNATHICDICGNVFAKLGRMMEHRQRHNKEPKYSCEICEQKFPSRELLRKHMFSHSGGKPLKCKYCSRTFYYESVRKAHEAVHQGHKPYVCDVCDKAFGYAHALKKHKLIHDEIKLYRCDYCNKDFRLLHHMKQHEMTKLHQNAVRFSTTGIIYEDSRDLMAVEQDLNDDDIIFIEEIADDQLASGS